MKNITMIASLIIVLSGCSTNPYDTPTNRAGLEITKSAAIGAVGGAAVGVIIGDNRKSTLIGAGLGAAVMGGVKAYDEYNK